MAGVAGAQVSVVASVAVEHQNLAVQAAPVVATQALQELPSVAGYFPCTQETNFESPALVHVTPAPSVTAVASQAVGERVGGRERGDLGQNKGSKCGF